MTEWIEPTAEFALSFWKLLCQMAPYLLFGFLAAGLLSVLVPRRAVERHLGGRGLWPVLKASAFGVPLPLCSCSVLPVTASLRRHGASRGAATAFLISTPQTGVDALLVTYSLLGPVFAIFKPLAALASGLVGGLMVDALEPREAEHLEAAEPCRDACCAEGTGRGKLVRALSYGFVNLPRDIGKPLLIGLAVAGVIGALVSPGQLEALGGGPWAILVLMAVGIPMYVCASASAPVAAMLIVAGVSPGAALAFLMTGPATNAAGLALVWRVMGPRTALVYLGTVAVTAFASGLILNYTAGPLVVEAVEHLHRSAPGLVGQSSAVVLLLVLGLALLRREEPGHDHAHGEQHDD
jgi:hypothetical protein